jgi:putative ABC transport system permease protein
VGQKSVAVTLAGIVKQMGRPTVFMDREEFNRIFNPEGWVNSLFFELKNRKAVDLDAAQQRIEQAIESSGLNVASTVSNAGLIKIIYDHLNIILVMLILLALLVLVMGALGMASATGINVMERTREIGVMRAIGATPGAISRMFVGEGIVIGIVSLIAGMILSLPMSSRVAGFFGNLILETPLDFAFSTAGFCVTLAVTFSFAWLASRIPAGRAVKIPTREALAYE